MIALKITPKRKENPHNQYKILRNSVKMDIRQAKLSYFNKYFGDNKPNIGNIWNGINSLVTLKS